MPNRNNLQYKTEEKFYRFTIPRSKRILVIGCGDGDLLASMEPSYGVGVDTDNRAIDAAQRDHPEYKFYAMDTGRELPFGKFDYVIVRGTADKINDPRILFNNLKAAGDEFTCYVISHYPGIFGLDRTDSVCDLLKLCGLETIKVRGQRSLRFIFAKRDCPGIRDYGASVIVPCRNEEGNIMEAAKRIPVMGKHTEIIFVDNGSTDHTADEVRKAIKEYPQKDIKLYFQPEAGKKNAVAEGFDRASQEVLMILDADLSTAPEELVKFFGVVASGKAEFVNGTRMVYPRQKGAMRYLNALGNRAFARIFSYILDFPLTDTLCGVKVLLKRFWPDIKRSEISERKSLDRWGDFDLLFGAASWNLKMAEIPVHYMARIRGESKMGRFTYGFQLLRMSFISFKRFKKIW